MSRRALALFIITGFLWGIPYLLIKVAVGDAQGFSPAIVVFGRVLIGCLILIPLAIRAGSLSSALHGIKFVLPYAILEMIGPWILIATAEKKISSGLAGLLIASVPIWATIFASFAGDKTVWHHKRLMGMVIGFLGVIAVVGIETLKGTSNPLAVSMVLLAAVGYAYAVTMVTTKLPGVSGIAINGVAMGLTAIFYLPFAIAQWPSHAIKSSAIFSVIGLGVFSTGLAFVLFFIVMAEIGPARASLVTYLNTAFAVVLGVLILHEPLTTGIIIGLPMVLIGSYLASRKERVKI